MLTDWKKPTIVDAWCQAVGEYGDIFQMTITNPFVLGILASIKDGKTLNPEQQFADFVSKQREFANAEYTDEQLNKWHTKSKETKLDDLRLLDLGGGEGYMGRWLCCMGAKYCCIDGSDPLLERGRTLATARSLDEHMHFHPRDLARKPRNSSFLVNATGSLWPNGELPHAVLCLSVLDHLPKPESLMRPLVEWLGDDRQYNPDRPVICVTLNPDFFFPAEHWADREHSERRERARLGPAKQDVDIFPRSWQWYEKAFVSWGYRVRWCFPTFFTHAPARLQERYREQAGLTHDPSTGPFVLWVLTADRRGVSVAPEEVEKSRLASLLGNSQSVKRLIQEAHIRRKTYPPDETVLYSQQLTCGAHFIESGSLLLQRDSTPQPFKPGELIGELESKRNFFVSRYIYPVTAGNSGATVIHIPADAFDELLEQSPASLASQLFCKLRDRVAAESWIYHRSIRRKDTFSIRVPASNNTSTVLKITNKNPSATKIEDCARGVLFAATCEREKEVATSGLTVLLPVNELDVLMPRHATTDQERKDLLRLLVAIGAIDVFPGTSTSYNVNGVRNQLQKAWDELVTAAYRTLVADSDVFRKSDLAYNKQLFDKQGKLVITKAAKAWIKDFVYASQNGADKWDMKARRFVCNLAFLQRVFFKWNSYAFFRVNDMHFLRHLAFGSDDLERGIQQRVNLSICDPKATPQMLAVQDSERFGAYLMHIRQFCVAHWEKDKDVMESLDEYRGQKGTVAECVSRLEAENAEA